MILYMISYVKRNGEYTLKLQRVQKKPFTFRLSRTCSKDGYGYFPNHIFNGSTKFPQKIENIYRQNKQPPRKSFLYWQLFSYSGSLKISRYSVETIFEIFVCTPPPILVYFS